MFHIAWKRLTVAAALAVGSVLTAVGPAEAGWYRWYWPCCGPYVAAYPTVVYRPVVRAPILASPWCCGYGSTPYWLAGACCDNGSGSWYAPAYSTWPSQSCCDGAIVGTTPAVPVPQPAVTAPKPPAAQPVPAPARPRDWTPSQDRSLLPPSTKDFIPPAANNAPLPGPKETRESPRDNAILTVTVPEQAKVFVNGMLTRTPGTLRRYVSRNLQPGFPYTYEVRAEIPLNGRWVGDTRVVQLRAGQTLEVAFDFAARQPGVVPTTLTIHVPEKAVVTLSGRNTHATGSVRQFTTTDLLIGQKWENYRVAVAVERNGRVLHRETAVTLVGGESRELTFDFGDGQLARR